MLYSGVAELQAFEGVDKEILIKELEMENEGENNIVEGNTPGILENNKKEINLCENRINKCEGLIGYKLLGKPNYSFMKKI